MYLCGVVRYVYLYEVVQRHPVALWQFVHNCCPRADRLLAMCWPSAGHVPTMCCQCTVTALTTVCRYVYLYGVVPWLLLLVAFGSSVGVALYYTIGGGSITIDMSLGSFQVQSHPTSRASDVMDSTFPWCQFEDQCVEQKCPPGTHMWLAVPVFGSVKRMWHLRRWALKE